MKKRKRKYALVAINPFASASKRKRAADIARRAKGKKYIYVIGN